MVNALASEYFIKLLLKLQSLLAFSNRNSSAIANFINKQKQLNKKRGAYMFFGKKASLELSISAIVIVILAMTLLGLGLAFVKNVFSNTEEISASTFEKVSDQLQKNLADSDENLVFSQYKISIDRGSSSLLGWGIRNGKGSKINYWAEFTALKCPSVCPAKEELNSKWFTFKYNPNGNDNSLLYDAPANDLSIKRVDLSVPRTAAPGLYLMDLSVYEEKGIEDEKYASTEIFVTVD